MKKAEDEMKRINLGEHEPLTTALFCFICLLILNIEYFT